VLGAEAVLAVLAVATDLPTATGLLVVVEAVVPEVQVMVDRGTSRRTLHLL
jgi:hypothetical protein